MVFRRDPALWRRERFPTIAVGIGRCIKNAAENGAATVVVLRDLVDRQFYRIDLEAAAEGMISKFLFDDFLNRLNFPISDECKARLNSQTQHRLEEVFFRYFYARLQLLLRYNRPIHQGPARAPSQMEEETLSRVTFAVWDGHHGDTDYNRIGIERRKVLKTCHWYIPSKARDKVVYDFQWMWSGLEESWPGLMAPVGNPYHLWRSIVQEYEPAFWNTLLDHYRLSLFHHATFGLFSDTGNEPLDVHGLNGLLDPHYHFNTSA